MANNYKVIIENTRTGHTVEFREEIDEQDIQIINGFAAEGKYNKWFDQVMNLIAEDMNITVSLPGDD